MNDVAIDIIKTAAFVVAMAVAGWLYVQLLHYAHTAHGRAGVFAVTGVVFMAPIAGMIYSTLRYSRKIAHLHTEPKERKP